MKRIYRYICYFLYIAFFRHTPEEYRPYSLFFPLLRKLLVQSFLNECGKGITVKSNADISMFIKSGNNSEFGTRCMVQSQVTIGDNVIMGPDVKIYSRNHRYDDTDAPIQLQGKIQRQTVIGNDVWIGANVLILPGVTVGNHVVIGAGAVVTKDIEDYSVVGGNPAIVIKKRIDGNYGES